MKKIIIVVLTSVVTCVTAIAQIPNDEFENWTNLVACDIPNDWGTLNNMTAPAGVFTCMKGNLGVVGDRYLKLESKDVREKELCLVWL
jgi:hypothetical protein